MTSSRAALLLILSLFACPLFAANYSVDPRVGKDTNLGTSEANAAGTKAIELK